MALVGSEVVELKAEVVGDICKEVIAFANTKGGTLYIGVSNDGSVVGVKNADQVMLQLNNMIRDSIKPDVTMFVGYEPQHLGDKDIIAVTIQKGIDRPYYLGSKGLKPSGVYVRNGTSSDPATDTAIRRMVKETMATASNPCVRWNRASALKRQRSNLRNETSHLILQKCRPLG